MEWGGGGRKCTYRKILLHNINFIVAPFNILTRGRGRDGRDMFKFGAGTCVTKCCKRLIFAPNLMTAW